MTTFGTGDRDSLNGVDDLNAAIRAEFEDLMVRKHGSIDAYFRASGVDKRNFYKVLSRSPQIGWIDEKLRWFEVSIGDFFDGVSKQRGQ